MARFSVLCLCVCAVIVSSAFVNDVDAFGLRSWTGGISSWFQAKPQHFKPPPRAPSNSWKTQVNRHHFLGSERSSNRGTAPRPHINTRPVGFENVQNKPHTNTAPIGFEYFQRSARIPQTNTAPIGFEYFQRSARIPQTNTASIGFKHFQKSARIPHTNTAPIDFEHFQKSARIPPTNAAPIGFEHFQNPVSKSQAPVGFESFNKKANAPSAPAMPVPHQHIPNIPSAPVVPVPHQNIPNAPGMPNANTGFNQPVGGNFASSQYPAKVNNPYQTNPNSGWDTHGSTHFKPSNNYPNTGYPNSGYTNTGYPNSGYTNTGHSNIGYPNSYPNIGYPNTGYSNVGYPNTGFSSNPSQSFGHSYYGSNPNFGHQSYPTNYFGNSHYGAPNSFGNPYSGNAYNPYGNNYYPGAGYGYGGYPGQFSNNNYKPKSKFGFGGLPIPIPIPIPIPLGAFGLGGLGGYHSDDKSHRILNTLQNTTSLNSTANATSIYVVNNITVVSCTNELFTYGPVNMTVTTCTADNCTSVKLYVATNSSVNHATLTMCLGPNVTVTSNSSDAVKPEVSNISSYWQMICALSANTTLNGTAVNTTTLNVTEPTVSTTETHLNATCSTTSVGAVNLTGYRNSTSNTTLVGAVNLTANTANRLCEILNCSYVVMCLPETAIDNNTKTAYRPCVRVKMCKSPNTPIAHHVTLNTTIIRYEGVNNVVNKTESYSLNNITVLTFYPIINSCSMNSTGNDTSCYQPVTNATGFAQVKINSTVAACAGGDITSFCNTTVAGNVTSSDFLELAELKKRLERLQQSETELKNVTSVGGLLEFMENRKL